MTDTATGRGAVQWFDGVTARARAAAVSVERRSLLVQADDRAADYPLDALVLSVPVAGVPLRLTLPDGGTLVFREPHEQIAGLLQRPDRSFAHRLERNLVAVVCALAGVALLAYFGWRDGVPWLAARVAQRVPVAAESNLGAAVLSSLDEIAFDPTRLPVEDRAPIDAAFARLVAAADLPAPEVLQFRHAHRFVGANALALPGGTIVVTDQLVKAAPAPELVAAVLAHELGHQAGRHAMQQLLQSSAAALIFGTVMGDVSGVGSVAAAAPGVFLNMKYSRGAEEEADRYAWALLKRVGSSPARLADALEAIAGITCAEMRDNDSDSDSDGDDGNATDDRGHDDGPARGGAGDCRRARGMPARVPDYLSTHPDIQGRIAAARAAAER